VRGRVTNRCSVARKDRIPACAGKAESFRDKEVFGEAGEDGSRCSTVGTTVTTTTTVPCYIGNL